MDIKVCKFGGSSLGSPARLKQIVRIVTSDPARRCVVVSAPGKAEDAPVKVTDLLIGLTEILLADGDPTDAIAAVKRRYHDVYDPLGLQDDVAEVTQDLDRRATADPSDPARLRDLLASAGEDLNAQLFARYLDRAGVPAVYVSPGEAELIVTEDFGNAQPIEDAAIRMAHLRKICAEKVIVFPGFFGVTESGEIATFSRGGSDLTGALMAEVLDAVEYENFTDVDGICSANPQMVDSPEQIDALTYREMRELSYMGFNVFHEEAVWPAMRRHIPIRLRNTMNPDNPGTLIVAERLPDERDVVGIASSSEFCSITVTKYLMNRELGFGRKLLAIVEEMELPFEHMPSTVDSVSLVLSQDMLDSESVHKLMRAIRQGLEPDDVTMEYGIALIAVVGEGLNHKVGVMAQAAGALADAEVNLKIVNQGSSEISMIFGVDVADEAHAVRALYHRFFGDD